MDNAFFSWVTITFNLIGVLIWQIIGFTWCLGKEQKAIKLTNCYLTFESFYNYVENETKKEHCLAYLLSNQTYVFLKSLNCRKFIGKEFVMMVLKEFGMMFFVFIIYCIILLPLNLLISFILGLRIV